MERCYVDPVDIQNSQPFIDFQSRMIFLSNKNISSPYLSLDAKHHELEQAFCILKI
jgi:hypothetical protein